MSWLRLEIRRQVAYFRTRKKSYILKQLLGASVVFVPLGAGLALHFLAGVGSLALLAVGTISFAVGCVFFVTKEDEFLVGLWLGVSLLVALLLIALVEGHTFSL